MSIYKFVYLPKMWLKCFHMSDFVLIKLNGNSVFLLSTNSDQYGYHGGL